MGSPFFTVLVPTKNRPDLIPDALWSIQRQIFTNFEVFIIDNGEEGKLCEEATSEFLKDPRFTYLRTGGLSMPDNWEFAYEQGIGQYKLILSDRLIWSTDEFLERLHHLLNIHDVPVVSWKYGMLHQAVLTNPHRSRVPMVYRSDDILRKLGAGDYEFYSQTSPRGLNSCVRRDLIDRIRAKFGRFCHPFAPDFTSSNLLLFSEPELLHIDANIVYEADLTDSNGTNCRNNIQYCKKSLSSLGGSWEGSTEHVPAKIPSVYNTVFNDLLTMAKLTGLKADVGSMIDPVAYFLMIRQDLDHYIMENNVFKALSEWDHALSSQPIAVQQAVREAISSERKAAPPAGDKRSAARKLASRIKQAILSGRSTESTLKSPSPEEKIDVRKAVEEAQHTVFGRLL